VVVTPGLKVQVKGGVMVIFWVRLVEKLAALFP
jgi:hypothetical protein